MCGTPMLLADSALVSDKGTQEFAVEVYCVLDGIPVPETGTLLDKEGIAVRAGHHCAQPALRALGYEMSVRPTFALYNTREDVDKLVIAVKKIIGR